MKKLITQLQTEIDTAYLYQKLSENHEDKLVAEVFLKMSHIEERHAHKVLKKIHEIQPNFLILPPSYRVRLQVYLAKCFGFGFIISNLTALEFQLSQSIIDKKKQTGEKITGLENVHLKIIQNLSQQKHLPIGGSQISRFEGKHKSVGGNELRAAVLGANDGLLSNMSLVMGVAGASHGNTQVLIAGIAGLLAGSFSMALGEWISVRSSDELYQRQIEIEAEELENSPEEEMNELVLLYQAKGMSLDAATNLAKEVMSDKETALASLVFEELGIDKDALGGAAWKAAVTSFVLFSLGAIIPLLPYCLFTGNKATPFCLVFSAIGLFAIGAAITLFTGKSVLYSGLRQILFGFAISGITYSIGKIIGFSIS